MEDLNRRTLLGTAGVLGAGVALGGMAGPAAADAPFAGPHGVPAASAPSGMRAAEEAAARLLPDHAGQLRFSTLKGGGGDRFTVSGKAGDVRIAGTTPAAALTGLHWYLKYTCHAHISWAGSQLSLPATLPSPGRGHDRSATVPHRYVLNDTHDGYTAPYADWPHWERFIDVLALHGCNEVLVTCGTEAVYHRLLQDFGYSDAEARAWIPAPSHQPWWLLQNMSEYGGPLSSGLLERRTELGRRIVKRLRELGMHPVLPGWFGTVPDDFADRNPGGRTVPQGDWNGLPRPDWLDPRTSVFRKAGESFYAHQRDLYGDIRHVKMDLLHEGGKAGDVPVPDAARAVEAALHKARPGATWVILGWQKNPRRELLDALRHKDDVLVVDGRSDLEQTTDREADWGSVPYCFGSIPEFGGRTTLGAKTNVWAERFTEWRDKAGSTLMGTAYMPEAADRDPAAFELFSELAWREEAVDREAWFADYARLRYGGQDAAAREAFATMRDTAYQISNKDGRPHDSIFAARPSLTARSGTHYAAHQLGYDLPAFDPALDGLLRVRKELRGSDAYRYDLADTARQALANRSWLLIPQLQDAYENGDTAGFRKLSNLWLSLMRMSEDVAGTHTAFLLGPWLSAARRMGGGADEQDELERTARTLITTWAGRKAADDGHLANYANRDWQGLIGDFHLPQWKSYLEALEDALADGSTPKSFDWYAVEAPWTRKNDAYPQRPIGEVHPTVQRVHDTLAKAPYQGTLTVAAEPAALEPGQDGRLTATFRNENGLRPTGTVDFTLTGLHDAEPHGATSVTHVRSGEEAAVRWRVPAPGGELTRPLQPMRYRLAVSYGPRGESPVTTTRGGTLFLAGPLAKGLTTVNGNEAVFGQLDERYAINGGGADLWKGTAEFGAIRREGALRDGGSVTVRVTKQDRTGAWARAGLIARDDLAGSSSKGFVNLAVTPDNGVVLSYDSDGDGTLDTYRHVTGVQAPVTLRLTRDGSAFRGELSTDDGSSWRTVGTVTVPGTSGKQDAGLFMTAANGGTGARGTAEFDGWRIR